MDLEWRAYLGETREVVGREIQWSDNFHGLQIMTEANDLAPRASTKSVCTSR